jgi:dTDP-4-amino-4,6-dideoxygalactose transaminase
MTSGDGGILLTNDEKLYDLAKGISSFGYGYPEPILASNYRISEFQAAVLRVQFKRLDGQRETRWKNFQYLIEKLEGIEGITVPSIDERVTRWSVYFLFARYDRQAFGGISKQRFIEAVQAEGIEVIGEGYSPLYRYPLLERLADEESFDMWLYNFLLGARPDIDDVVDAIRKVRENIDELR